MKIDIEKIESRFADNPVNIALENETNKEQESVITIADLKYISEHLNEFLEKK